MAAWIIVNPQARKGGNPALLAHHLGARDYRLSFTAYPGHAGHLARQALREGFSKVIVAGGDGTVNEVVNALAEKPLALGIIPTGGANDLARHLGIPADPVQALEVALNGRERQVDLVRVQDRYFVTVGGLGFGTTVADLVNRLKQQSRWWWAGYRLLGGSIYTGVALWKLFSKKNDTICCTLTVEGHTRRLRLWCLFVGNQPRVGRYFLIHPQAVNDDQWLDLCLIGADAGPWRKFHTALLATRGRHLSLPQVEVQRVRGLRIEADQPLTFFGDGELLVQAAALQVELVPRALRVMVPRPAPNT